MRRVYIVDEMREGTTISSFVAIFSLYFFESSNLQRSSSRSLSEDLQIFKHSSFFQKIYQNFS
ncbi:hypothetical protein Hanom_Chr06g00536051 [Helianthus anomalus]